MSFVLLLAYLFFQAPSADLSLPPEALALMQSGIDAEKRNDLDSAVLAFRKATDLAPTSAIVFVRLGDAYMKKLDYASAIPPLKHAVELNPDSPPIHQLLGYALLAEGYASEAIPHLELVHDSGALGIAQLQAGQPAEAVANLEAALAKSPNDPDLLYYLSQAASALSSQSLDKLLSTFPNSSRGHQAKGQTYYGMKMLAESANEFEQAIALRPDLPGLRLELGLVYAARSDWLKAEQQFRAETKLQPGNAEAAFRLGDTLLQQGKMKEAAEELRRSNALHPDMPETLYALGRACAVSDPVAAERALDRVVEMEKESQLAAEADFVLAGIHRREGKTGLAAREMQEFRRLKALDELRPKSVP
jgi:tetratricopeptide (TPR) repeat protein